MSTVSKTSETLSVALSWHSFFQLLVVTQICGGKEGLLLAPALGSPSYLFNSLVDPSIRATALLAKLALSLIIPSPQSSYSSNADHYSQSFAFVHSNSRKKASLMKLGNDQAVLSLLL